MFDTVRHSSASVGARRKLSALARYSSAAVGYRRQWSVVFASTRRHRSVLAGIGRRTSEVVGSRPSNSSVAFGCGRRYSPAVGSGFRSLSLYRRVSRQLQTNCYESKATRNPICLRSSRVVSRDVISDDIITRQPTRAGVTSNAHAHHTRRILEIAANNLIIDPSLLAMLSICAEQILTAILSTELSRCALHDHTRDSNVCVFYTNAKVKLVKNA